MRQHSILFLSVSLAVVLGIVLTACATVVRLRNLKAEQCPAVYIAGGAEVYRRDTGFVAALTEASIKCGINRDTRAIQIMIPYRIGVTGALGGVSSQIDLPIMALLLTPDGEIIERIDARTRLPLSDTSSSDVLGFEKVLGPFAFGGQGGRLDQYHYLIGFGLSKSQAAANARAQAQRLVAP